MIVVTILLGIIIFQLVGLMYLAVLMRVDLPRTLSLYAKFIRVEVKNLKRELCLEISEGLAARKKKAPPGPPPVEP